MLGLAAVLSAAAGCGADGLAHAGANRAAPVEAVSRLVFAEDPVGSQETAQRWGATEEVEIRGFVGPGDEAGIELIAAAGGIARAEPRTQPDYARANRLALQLQAVAASPDSPVELEIEFHDDRARNRFWQVVTLEHGDWQTVELPLPQLRYDRGVVPRWEDVTAWGFTFRTDAHLKIRSFELYEDGDEASPYLGADDLRALFPDPGEVRQAHRGSFVVMTNHPELDMTAVHDALEQMHRRTLLHFPNLQTPERPVPLLIFETPKQYRRFWKTFSERVGSSARPLPEDHGYTWLGVATASYSDRYGPVRPIYVHEASHALLERSLGLDAQRSWLFEGLGNYEQLEISGQDISRVYREALTRSDVKMPLEELVAGDPIPTSRYWQATLLVEWMLEDPTRTRALGAAMEEMRVSGSADLRPVLDRHFGLDLPRLSAEFWSWAWSRYARTPGA